MYLDWTTLSLLCLAAAIAWFWQDSLAAREVANAAAMEACEQLSLQFLDGTVAFARLRLGRAPSGRLIFRRTYVFDYTANSIERRQGFVILVGRRVESVGYAPGEEQRAQRPQQPPMTVSMSTTVSPPAPPDQPKPAAPAQPNNSAVVLDLAEWRERRRGQEQHSSQRRDSERGNGQADGQDSHP